MDPITTSPLPRVYNRQGPASGFVRDGLSHRVYLVFVAVFVESARLTSSHAEGFGACEWSNFQGSAEVSEPAQLLFPEEGALEVKDLGLEAFGFAIRGCFDYGGPAGGAHDSMSPWDCGSGGKSGRGESGGGGRDRYRGFAYGENQQSPDAMS